MQSRAICRNSPHVYRVVKAVPSTTRTMSLFGPRTFGFPVVPSGAFSNPFAVSHSYGREVAPLFHIMDDLSRHLETAFFPLSNTQARTQQPAPFAPRFDVREVDGAYELRGELPGVDASNLQVEFTDANTLVIRGSVDLETSSGTPPMESTTQTQQTVEAAETSDALATNAVADDAASIHSNSSYHKATVQDAEEDGVIVERDEAASTPGQATPAESVTSQSAQAQTTEGTTGSSTSPTEVAQASQATTPHYWVSERRTGSFQRSFNFPGKIDQEGVNASLKNGVLNVIVPKAIKQSPRRINVL